jgi:hypothetical protein
MDACKFWLPHCRLLCWCGHVFFSRPCTHLSRLCAPICRRPSRGGSSFAVQPFVCADMVGAMTTAGAVDSCMIVGVAPLGCPRGRDVWGRSLGCITQPTCRLCTSVLCRQMGRAVRVSSVAFCRVACRHVWATVQQPWVYFVTFWAIGVLGHCHCKRCRNVSATYRLMGVARNQQPHKD